MNFMNTFISVVVVIISCGVSLVAQPSAPKPIDPPRFEAEIALAKLALDAHGGEKLRSMNTLVMRGSLDFTTSAFNQAIPATFVVILARDKYRFEVNNQFQPIKQVFDGVNTSTTIQGGITFPPITRLGFPLLQMIGQPGFIITPLPESRKKNKGFRMTSPEGYYTDFYLDEKTNQVKGYDSAYDIRGRQVSTSVEVDKMKVVDGISVPERYVQRVDTGQMTVYLEFKTKEILVNSKVDDDIFTIK
jgi:hypothetical protein